MDRDVDTVVMRLNSLEEEILSSERILACHCLLPKNTCVTNGGTSTDGCDPSRARRLQIPQCPLTLSQNLQVRDSPTLHHTRCSRL